MTPAEDTFRVVAHDDHGQPVRCSYCPREVKHVVVLPLTQQPVDDDGRWLGLCAYCVLEMARALARAEAAVP